MKTVSFKTTKAERKLIHKIAKRAVKLSQSEGIKYDLADCEMDLMATHANGCPLDFKKLLSAKSGNFGHDVFGIRRFLDRETGTLTNFFDPRCSRPA